eukprot:COSAG04_NODE_20386_length_394_cov_1.755932_1_plen_90_part_10
MKRPQQTLLLRWPRIFRLIALLRSVQQVGADDEIEPPIVLGRPSQLLRSRAQLPQHRLALRAPQQRRRRASDVCRRQRRAVGAEVRRGQR